MGDKITREKRTFECPEAERTAELFIEWEEKAGKRLIKSMSCDHPRLRDIDNWDCHWTCWEQVRKDSE
jgi:hypothetical protein